MSDIRIVEDVIILSLSIENLNRRHHSYRLTTDVVVFNKSKIIVDLASIEFMTSADFNKLEELSEMFRLNGLRCIFCNLSPRIIAVLTHSIHMTKLHFAGNIDKAIYELNH